MRREARQIRAAPTAKSAFGSVYKPVRPHENHANPRDYSLETSSESDFLEIRQRSRDREYSVFVEGTRLSKHRI